EKGNVAIKEGVKPEEANEIKKKFEESGAKINIQ
ncbi:MAG: ribosomal protein L7/L12, partial [Bacteroidales bacterium]|nr:ribosomal protein L7/L12 [Bacteroidales bacterium]